jgi:dihydropteroate synthase
VAAELDVPVCLMHMQGTPATMQQNPAYQDVVAEVKDFLAARIAAAVDAGIDIEKIIIDPGFGFGKTIEHNLLLLKSLAEFRELGVRVLAGLAFPWRSWPRCWAQTSCACTTSGRLQTPSRWCERSARWPDGP